MFNFLTEKFSSIFSNILGKNQLTQKNIDEALQQVTDALIEADVPYEVTKTFISQVQAESIGKNVTKSLNPGEQFIKIVYDKLCEFMGGQVAHFSFQIPSVIMVLGLQGSGKTTTVAKLANYLIESAKKKGKKREILLASVDFNRPAAIDQLEILSKQLDLKFYRSKITDDSVKAASEIFQHFKSLNFEHLILDTAGRLHIDGKMIQELKEIDNILNPKYKILVLDSMTGQESLKVAQAFEDGVGFNGSILTKIDSETRAGAAFAFRFTLKKPIFFIGSGEKICDLEQFYPDRIATRILGMGDILSLIEKAEEKIKKNEQTDLANTLVSGKFTLQDFANQMNMVNRLGSLSKLAQYLPGMGSMKIDQAMIEKGEIEIKKFKAIISSMTMKERLFPSILEISRMQRIAKGSGTNVSDVKLLLEKFEQTKQFAKLFKKYGNSKNMFK